MVAKSPEEDIKKLLRRINIFDDRTPAHAYVSAVANILTDADLLSITESVIDYLKRNGWIQGKLFAEYYTYPGVSNWYLSGPPPQPLPRTAACIMGAAGQVVKNRYTKYTWNVVFLDSVALYWAKRVCAITGWTSIPIFNDDPTTTPELVIKELEFVAEEFREKVNQGASTTAISGTSSSLPANRS